jgi:hypothetical protein
VTGTLFIGAQIVFLLAAMIMFTIYGVRLMMESSDDSTVSEVKSAYTYGIAGAGIVSLAGIIVTAVGQNAANNSGGLVQTALVNTTIAGPGPGSIVYYIRTIVGAAVAAVVVYQGIRLIILQGEESELEAQKKRFFHTLIGVAVITLASTIVSDFVPTVGGGTGNSGDLALQMVGIANFLMVIIGGLAVLAFIIGGLLLVISTDEALKDRAKKAMFTAVIGLIIVLCTYTIIYFIIDIHSAGFTPNFS